MILLWVDDIIITASDKRGIDKVKNMLNVKFRMKDLGKLSHFLDIAFEQGQGSVKMNQKDYMMKMLQRFNMDDCKPRTTPSKQKVEVHSCEFHDAREYRMAVGSLIYAMSCTRLDIC